MENNMTNNQIFKMTALSEDFLAGFKFITPMVDSSVEGDFKILMQRAASATEPGVSSLRLSAGGIESSITITDIRATSIEGDVSMYVNGKEFVGKLGKLPTGEVELSVDANQDIIKINCQGNYMEISCDVVGEVLTQNTEMTEAEAELMKYRVSLVQEINKNRGAMNMLGEFAISQKDFVDIVKGLEKNPCIIDKEKFIKLRVFKEQRLVQMIDPETKKPIIDQNGTVRTEVRIVDVVEGISGDIDKVSKIRRDGYMENGHQLKISQALNSNELSLFINLDIASNVVEAINKVKNIGKLKQEPLVINKTDSGMYIKFGPARFMCRVQDLSANYSLDMFDYSANWCGRVDLAEFKRTIELLNLSLSNIGGAKTSTLEVESITRFVPVESAIRFEGSSFNGAVVSLKLPYTVPEGLNDFPPTWNPKIKVARKYIKEGLSSMESKSGKQVEIGLHLYKQKLVYQKDPQGRILKDEQGQPLTMAIPEMLLSISDATLGQYGVNQIMRVEVIE